MAREGCPRTEDVMMVAVEEVRAPRRATRLRSSSPRPRKAEKLSRCFAFVHHLPRLVPRHLCFDAPLRFRLPKQQTRWLLKQPQIAASPWGNTLRPQVRLCVLYVHHLPRLTPTHEDKKTRDKAIKNLAAFLSDPSRDALPKAEMTKLWKGIFYCAFTTHAILWSNAHAHLSTMARLLDVRQTPGSTGTCDRDRRNSPHDHRPLCIARFLAWFLGDDRARVEQYRSATVSTRMAARSRSGQQF